MVEFSLYMHEALGLIFIITKREGIKNCFLFKKICFSLKKNECEVETNLRNSHQLKFTSTVNFIVLDFSLLPVVT